MKTMIADVLFDAKVFDDRNSDVRRCAAYVAREVGLNCSKVVETLHFMLGDPVDWVAEVASKAILSFDDISSDLRRAAEETLAFIESPPDRRGFPPSLPPESLESLSASDLMPDPDYKAPGSRRIRKMPTETN